MRKRSLIIVRDGVYYVSFRLHGTRVRRSLKTTDRREAERAAAQIYADTAAGLVPGALPLPGPLGAALRGLASKADLAALAAQIEAGFAALAAKLESAQAERTQQQPGVNGFAPADGSTAMLRSDTASAGRVEFDDILRRAAAAKAPRRAAKIRRPGRPAPHRPRRPS